MSASGKVLPLVAPRPCPICKKKSVPAYHPFCSRHCADVDLNRWLKGAYAIPAVEAPDEWADEASDETEAARSRGQEQDEAEEG